MNDLLFTEPKKVDEIGLIVDALRYATIDPDRWHLTGFGWVDRTLVATLVKGRPITRTFLIVRVHVLYKDPLILGDVEFLLRFE